ncbi:HTH gntR-type domain-containing protein [Methylorubrum extorquens]
MFCDQIRQRTETAPRAALPAVAAALWKAFAEGHVTEAEAEALAALIEARQVSRSPDPETATGPINPDASQNRARSPMTGRSGSRPRTASMERRRGAASGRMPPAIAARFTLAEQSVLSLVAAGTCRRKDCRLSVGGMAAIAGVSETTVRNAIRWICEHAHQQMEEELGLDHFEGQSWTGLHRHALIRPAPFCDWASASHSPTLPARPSGSAARRCRRPDHSAGSGPGPTRPACLPPSAHHALGLP